MFRSHTMSKTAFKIKRGSPENGTYHKKTSTQRITRIYCNIPLLHSFLMSQIETPIE